MKTVAKVAVMATLGMVALTGCSAVDSAVSELEKHVTTSNPTISGTVIPVDTPNGLGLTPTERGGNYYEVMGTAVFDDTCTINPGEYNYTGVITANGQVGTACAVVNNNGTVERVDPTDDPAGYKGNNKRATIDYADGSDSYNGWFYNRSHMISASLGGSPTNENLVTGTRMQNVGESNQGGMRYTETIAEDYVKSGQATTCPLTYSVTPHYTTSADIVPQWVEVNMANCDKSIDTRVAVFNDANGYTIDYTTGAWVKN